MHACLTGRRSNKQGCCKADGGLSSAGTRGRGPIRWTALAMDRAALKFLERRRLCAVQQAVRRHGTAALAVEQRGAEPPAVRCQAVWGEALEHLSACGRRDSQAVMVDGCSI